MLLQPGAGDDVDERGPLPWLLGVAVAGLPGGAPVRVPRPVGEPGAEGEPATVEGDRPRTRAGHHAGHPLPLVDVPDHDAWLVRHRVVGPRHQAEPRRGDQARPCRRPTEQRAVTVRGHRDQPTVAVHVRRPATGRDQPLDVADLHGGVGEVQGAVGPPDHLGRVVLLRGGHGGQVVAGPEDGLGSAHLVGQPDDQDGDRHDARRQQPGPPPALDGRPRGPGRTAPPARSGRPPRPAPAPRSPAGRAAAGPTPPAPRRPGAPRGRPDRAAPGRRGRRPPGAPGADADGVRRRRAPSPTAPRRGRPPGRRHASRNAANPGPRPRCPPPREGRGRAAAARGRRRRRARWRTPRSPARPASLHGDPALLTGLRSRGWDSTSRRTPTPASWAGSPNHSPGSSSTCSTPRPATGRSTSAAGRAR